MQIIAGKARKVELLVPHGMQLRPTIGRVREALFNSIGSLEGRVVVDLFAGAGGLGLEAASRGADQVVMIESDPAHVRVIEQNILAVQKAGVHSQLRILQCDATRAEVYTRNMPAPELIFSDPPYAESVRYFNAMLSSYEFRHWAQHAVLIWEVPNYDGALGEFVNHGEYFTEEQTRNYEGVDFVMGRVAPPLKLGEDGTAETRTE
ncbi:MAG: RsmD family RNA methyltransferase [Victivallaceae bacterium]|nr:RsmD family RNA methyltransferase [Victivallaceae bacterium]